MTTTATRRRAHRRRTTGTLGVCSQRNRNADRNPAPVIGGRGDALTGSTGSATAAASDAPVLLRHAPLRQQRAGGGMRSRRPASSSYHGVAG